MSDRAGATRLVPLDGLRGIAIGLVLLHHYVQLKLPNAPGWPQILERVLKLSWSGVDLFFVLSGFLIGGLLMDHRSSPRLLRVFYLRRSLRVMPLYFGTLMVIYFHMHAGAYSHLPAWVYLTFTSNVAIALVGYWDTGALSVMWSLAVEEQFYLVAPWLVRWAAPERLVRVLLVMIGLAWLCRIGATILDPSGYSSHLLMPCRMDALGCGMLAAWAVRSPGARAWLAHHVPDGWTAALIAVPAAVVLTLFHESLADWNLQIVGYICLALFYAGVVFAVVVRQPPRLNAFLSWRPLVSLGRLSYFIYLWHTIAILVLGRRLMGGADFELNSLAAGMALLACLLATWGLAWVSWRFFEGPLVRLGHRWEY